MECGAKLVREREKKEFFISLYRVICYFSIRIYWTFPFYSYDSWVDRVSSQIIWHSRNYKKNKNNKPANIAAVSNMHCWLCLPSGQSWLKEELKKYHHKCWFRYSDNSCVLCLQWIPAKSELIKDWLQTILQWVSSNLLFLFLPSCLFHWLKDVFLAYSPGLGFIIAFLSLRISTYWYSSSSSMLQDICP